jgi:hypothetical protein
MPTQRRQLVFHVPIFRKSVKMAETANNPHPKIPENFDDPTARDKCHIYFIHQNGQIYCEPNVPYEGAAEGAGSEALCGDDRLTLMSAIRILVTWLGADMTLDNYKITFLRRANQ